MAEGFKLINFKDLTSNSSFLLEDGIKIDTPEQAEFDSGRSAQGDLQTTLLGSKSNITLEADRISATDLKSIRRMIHNRLDPHMIFLDFPSDASQEILFDATTDEIFEEASNNADLDLNTGTATEFIAGEYTNINDPTGSDVTKSTTALGHQYLYFRITLSSFLSARPTDPIKRITLAYKNLSISDLNGDNGIIIHAYDDTNNNWVEIKRQSVTLDQNYTGFASIRPVDGFGNIDDFLDGSNRVIIRIKNLNINPDIGGATALSLKIRFAQIFVNGYGVVFNGIDNASFRETFTGSGYIQTLNFLEL